MTTRSSCLESHLVLCDRTLKDGGHYDARPGGSVSRDSVESLLDRGRSYLSQMWDPEAFRFAQWLDDADSELRLQPEGAEGCSNEKTLHDLYHLYAAAQVNNTLALVLRTPFISRHVAKQEFVCLYVMFRCGIRSRDGAGKYRLQPSAAVCILSFLGHQLTVQAHPHQPPQRHVCYHFDDVCPLFYHRSERFFASLRVASSSSSSSFIDVASDAGSSDDEDIASNASSCYTGSVSATRRELLAHLSQQGGVA